MLSNYFKCRRKRLASTKKKGRKLMFLSQTLSVSQKRSLKIKTHSDLSEIIAFYIKAERLLKGDLATPSWKTQSFAHYLLQGCDIKNQPPSICKHNTNYHLTTRKFETDWNMKKRAFYIFWAWCDSYVGHFFDIQIGYDYIYKSTTADSWYRSPEVSNAPKTEFLQWRR